jgi:hypothetical protein
MPGHRKYEGRHRLHDDGGASDAAEPQPGTASMAQGQPEAGVDPAEEKPEQPDNAVTGGEALEEQQKNPDLKDSAGAHP